MKIVEFREKYPNYSYGFLADNSITDTELAFGMTMHLLFHEKRNKTYQVFTLPDEDIDYMLDNVAKAGSGRYSVLKVKDVTLHLINDDGLILGYCVETQERVAFNKPIEVSIFV